MPPVAPLQALYLEVVPVIGVSQEVNLTAVLLPLNPNLTVFYWWIGHSLQVCRPWAPGGPCSPQAPVWGGVGQIPPSVLGRTEHLTPWKRGGRTPTLPSP